MAFNPLSTDVLVTVGREHLAWWKVFPETRTTDLYAKPDYEVRICREQSDFYLKYFGLKGLYHRKIDPESYE